MAASSAATRARRSGTGTSCRHGSTAESRITRRANASVGINGVVLNNVNANPSILTAPYLQKAAALARVLRPYGIRVYLSVNFAAPRVLSAGCRRPIRSTPGVARWWRDKAAEIYGLIPDFGGFLVKANSEGQPGPQDYGRTHAEGANMLADALAPQGGIVMWRAFVYSADVDADRVKRAYLEFVPLDGKFRDNVIVQVKNGPLDFPAPRAIQPAVRRDAADATDGGAANHPGVSRPLGAPRVSRRRCGRKCSTRTRMPPGPDSPVKKVIDGTLQGHRLNGIAGVANTGQRCELDRPSISRRRTGTPTDVSRGTPISAPTRSPTNGSR